MTCYYPNRWYEGPVKDNGKISIAFKKKDSWRGVELNLPCGNCIGCLMARAKAWAARCMMEASQWEANSMITLTYDDKYLPWSGSLCYYDFKCFMKRLRKRYGPEIRFFMCGEYGPEKLRPHYHSLLFNHDFSDRTLFSETEAGSPIYVSKELQNLWGKGYSSVTDVNYKSASYVARYNLKKALNPSRLPDGLDKEFIQMSRKPGIGDAWYQKFKTDVFPSDQVVLSGGVVMKPPRFFDNKLDKEDPNLFRELKLKRKKEGSKMEIDVLPSGKEILVPRDYQARLNVKEEVFRAGLSRLKRSLEEQL